MIDSFNSSFSSGFFLAIHSNKLKQTRVRKMEIQPVDWSDSKVGLKSTDPSLEGLNKIGIIIPKMAKTG